MLALPRRDLDLPLFLLTLLAATLVQIGTNLVDEYADHQRSNSDVQTSKFMAQHKVIALGLLSSKTVKLGALVSFSTAAALGMYIIIMTGWPILILCVSSLAIAYLYSAGPIPLGNLGLGQPIVFIFMGPVMVLGTLYVQVQAITWEDLLISLPVGCLVTAILTANDLRDLEEDRIGGKQTLVTWRGRAFGRKIFVSLVVAAYLLVVLTMITGLTPWSSLLVLFSIPWSLKTYRLINTSHKKLVLNDALRSTAFLHLQFGTLLATGLALGNLI
jgi:1,4-dihydroxy-2-naphthoate octaprenyltransferase